MLATIATVSSYFLSLAFLVPLHLAQTPYTPPSTHDVIVQSTRADAAWLQARGEIPLHASRSSLSITIPLYHPLPQAVNQWTDESRKAIAVLCSALVTADRAPRARDAESSPATAAPVPRRAHPPRPL